MSVRRVVLRAAATVLAVALLTGCSTLQSKNGSKNRDKNGMPPQFGYLYSGMVSWAGNWCYFVSPYMKKPSAIVIAPIMFVFLWIDLPLTIVADTLFVPFELEVEPKAARLTLADECRFSRTDLTRD